MPSYCYHDGQLVEVPDTIITVSCDIREPVRNTLIIRSGARVRTLARISGTLIVERGAFLEAEAPVDGTVDVHSGGSATFLAEVGGTMHVRVGGLATLEHTAQALGSMMIDGVLTNKGVRGVQLSGHGQVIDAPGSTIRTPDETSPDGRQVHYYL